MARKEKKVVDYFPHYVNHKKTLYILENKYGNDGYATWFKLLELLGKNANHYIDFNNPATQEWIIAYCRLTRDKFYEILETLLVLGNIDKDLWKKNIIFSHQFIEEIESLYDRRNTDIMGKKDIMDLFTNGKKKGILKTDIEKDTIVQYFGEEFLTKWAEWIIYRKERRLPKYKDKGLKGALTRLSNLSNGCPETAGKIIDQSIGNNWQGLFGLKDNGKKFTEKASEFINNR